MSNLYNLGGASQAPASPNISTTGRASSPTQSSGGNNLPQQTAAVDVERSSPATRAPDTSALIEQAVSNLADFVDTHQRSLAFRVNNDTGDTIIEVRDSTTNEVVRQIPSEFAVELAQNLNRLRESLDISGGQGEINLIDFLGSKGNLFDANV